jgi:hypothetical protein
VCTCSQITTRDLWLADLVRDLTPQGFWALGWSGPFRDLVDFPSPQQASSPLLIPCHLSSSALFFLHHFSSSIHTCFQVCCIKLTLPSLLFTAASSSIIRLLHLHSTAYTLIALFISNPTTSPAQCSGRFTHMINTSFIANINGHWQTFPTLLLPLLLCQLPNFKV